MAKLPASIGVHHTPLLPVPSQNFLTGKVLGFFVVVVVEVSGLDVLLLGVGLVLFVVDTTLVEVVVALEDGRCVEGGLVATEKIKETFQFHNSAISINNHALDQ